MSLKQPAWHVLVLSMSTFKLYFIYWCYKNWRDLANHVTAKTAEHLTAKAADRQEEKSLGLTESLSPKHLSTFENASPMLRTLGVLIPYVNNYLYLTLVMGIAKLYPSPATFIATKPFLTALLIVLLSIALDLLAFLGGAWYLLFLLSAIPMALVQHWLNKYWDSIEPKGLLTRHGFSALELVAIIIGSLSMGFIVSSFMLGANKIH